MKWDCSYLHDHIEYIIHTWDLKVRELLVSLVVLAAGARGAAASEGGTPPRPRAGVAADAVDPYPFSPRVGTVAGAVDVVVDAVATSSLAN